MTLLKLSRTLKGTSKPDLSAIVTQKEYTFKEKDLLHDTICDLEIGLDTLMWQEPHITTKSGPNGQALVTSVYDLSILPPTLYKNIVTVGGSMLETYMGDIKENLDMDKWNTKYSVTAKGNLRKLSVVNDPDAKSRIIGILDYWSQTALKPLHDELLRIIKDKFRADCTYNQGLFLKYLPHMEGPYYSLDLKNATDSFSILFQKEVLSFIKSEDYSEAWADIMVGYPFKNIDPTGDPVYYKQGQPMGAYSSWPMFSLCHHLIVQMAAKKANKTLPWNQYALLGDDIVLTDATVVEYYRQLIKSVGGSFSEVKSHTSLHSYELAKRWIVNGTEITGAPLRAFLTKEKYSFLTEKVSELMTRWGYMERFPITVGPLKDLYCILHPSDLAAKWAEKGYMYWLLPKKQDSLQLAEHKIETLSVRTLSDCIGCNKKGPGFHKELWDQIISVITIESIDKGIRTSFDNIRTFIMSNDFKGFKSGSSQMPDDDFIKLIPAVNVSYKNVRDLQLEYDELVRIRYDPNSKWEDALNKFSDLAFSPTKLFQLRNNDMVLIKQSKLSARLLTWTDEYQKTRLNNLDEDYVNPEEDKQS